jgi:hypothetical protein
MIRDEEPSDNIILKTLSKNPLGRNEQLNTFLGLLNSITKDATITVDGDWGSGKTIFVKQIEYLSRISPEGISTLSDTVVEEFKDKYDVYYFNAWENDYHEDPLQSLLFSLINDTWSLREKLGDSVIKFTEGLRRSVLKVATLGIIDADQIDKATNISDLAKDINTATERKRAIDDILKNYLDMTGKRLIIIVDELDRCKPTYAVNLLEVIKHYYNDERIVFLLSTNNLQLSHTIKKVYGQSFDGSAYLNKFYDMIFNLPDLEPKAYIRYLGYKTEGGYWKDLAPVEVVEFLGFNIRQINRYYSSLKLIEAFFDTTEMFVDDNPSHQLVKYVLIPLAYGLRIKGNDDYDKFVAGKSEALIEEFYQSSNTLVTLVERITKGTEAQNPVEELKELYRKILTKSLSYTQDNYKYIESGETFRKVVLLMNASGKID